MTNQLTNQPPSNPLALTNGRIILPHQVVTGQALVIEAGAFAFLASPVIQLNCMADSNARDGMPACLV